ncbi:hypothetical protein P3S68_029541 [Capsicum galapagoense]
MQVRSELYIKYSPVGVRSSKSSAVFEDLTWVLLTATTFFESPSIIAIRKQSRRKRREKVGQALGLSTEWSSHALYTAGGLELLDGPEPENILVGPRVGIEYALPEHVNALWRFAIAGSSWISAPKKTLRPL